MEVVLPEPERERLIPKKITSSRALEFQDNIKKVCRVRNVIIFCLISLLLYWLFIAVSKCWLQPLSTDINYKYGEGELGTLFPQITLCQPDIFLKHPILKECGDGAWAFISVVDSCMKNNKTLNVADLIQNLHPEIENIVEMVQFWTGSKYVRLWPLNGKVWTRVFLDELGPCYTFDVSKVEKLKHVPLETDGFLRPGIEFVMAGKNLWQTAKLLLHTSFDLPDAYQLHGYVPLSFSDNVKKALKVEIQKKIYRRESTRKVPCVTYERRTCQSIKKYRAIFEKFGCSIPILYSGHHLENIKDIPKDISNCSYDVTPEVLQFYVNQSLDLNKGSNCSMAQTCKNVRFISNYKVDETWIENKTMVFVVFESPEVEYYNSYVSYNWMSLLAEIGGMLGLTLGASVFTSFEFLFHQIPYY